MGNPAGVSFGDAVKGGFNKYVTFSGRAPRSEFWFWVLFTFLGGFASALLDLLILGPDGTLFYAIFALGTLLPGIAVTVRRLHDTDRSGWWYFLFLIPLIGAIVLLVWFCSIGTEGDNRFGPDPLAS